MKLLIQSFLFIIGIIAIAAVTIIGIQYFDSNNSGDDVGVSNYVTQDQAKNIGALNPGGYDLGEITIENPISPIDKDTVCIDVLACGADGKTYANPCAAASAGVEVICNHECPCSVSDDTDASSEDSNEDSAENDTTDDQSENVESVTEEIEQSQIENICPALDSDNNGEIDVYDFLNFSRFYGSNCNVDPNAQLTCGYIDANGDSDIGLEDLLNFANYFRRTDCL